MSEYIYNDEDNVPMMEQNFDRIDQGGHNTTVYTSYAEMKAAERAPFEEEFVKRCGNCTAFNGDYCTAGWNNADESYKTEEDEREPDHEACELWELDPYWTEYDY